MNALWYYAIGFIIIWVIAILFRKQLKIDIEGPLLMRRTKRLRGFIDGIAQRSPRFWKWTMNIGIPVGFFFMLLMLYLLIISLQTLLQAPSVGLILPGVDIPGQPIFIPLGYGLIGLATVIIFHEFAHGILARVEGVRIKSIGVLLLAILPGAFVEPDEEEVKKVSRLAKLRIYVAGSISNLMLALVSLLIITTLGVFAIGPAFHPDGMQISSVVPKSPADGVLQQGMVIQSINDHPTTNTLRYLQSLNNTKIGDILTFQTNLGTYKVKTTASPNNASKAYVGIRSQENLVLNSGVSQIWGNSLPWILFPLRDLFYWIFILNFLIGTFNLLPMKPLDGGIMLEELLRYKLSEERARSIMYPLSLLIVAIIVVSVVYGTGRGLMMLF
ncbi:MAG: site-2 protease family protein [Methanobacteriaceae archaeon]